MIKIDKSLPTPIYAQIYEHFRESILSGRMREGERAPSITEIQSDLGVARESAKRALNQLAADGFVRKIQGKGTFVASRRIERRFWGFVVPFYTDFYNEAIVELRQAAGEQGIVLEHACDHDNWERQVAIVQEFAWRQAEAIIIVPTRDEARALDSYRKLSRRHALVLFDHSSIASQLPYVIEDYVLGVRLAMERMIRGGARRIAYVRDPLWPSGNPIYHTMEAAYAEVCADTSEGWTRVFDSPHELSDGMLRRPEFDALMCVNDRVACLLAGMLRERGVAVPDRVQLAGYHNSELGRFFTPQITTVGPDLSRMCRLLGEIIRRFKDGEPVEFLQHVVMPRLEDRGTTRQEPLEDALSGTAMRGA
jgi:DNA-binding LacI/PurR family transcriptional regulator